MIFQAIAFKDPVSHMYCPAHSAPTHETLSHFCYNSNNALELIKFWANKVPSTQRLDQFHHVPLCTTLLPNPQLLYLTNSSKISMFSVLDLYNISIAKHLLPKIYPWSSHVFTFFLTKVVLLLCFFFFIGASDVCVVGGGVLGIDNMELITLKGLISQNKSTAINKLVYIILLN